MGLGPSVNGSFLIFVLLHIAFTVGDFIELFSFEINGVLFVCLIWDSGILNTHMRLEINVLHYVFINVSDSFLIFILLHIGYTVGDLLIIVFI